MPFYRRVGSVPDKRHTQHRDKTGKIFYEELLGAEGFSAESSLAYHTHNPSAVVAAREWEPPDHMLTANRPLLARHLQLHQLFAASTSTSADTVTGRRLLLGNADVRIHYAVASTPSPLYRNAIGDECVFIEAGSATVETSLGTLVVRPGDYVVVPRSVTHRWIPTPEEKLRTFIIEASGHIRPPRRYLSQSGQFLEHAPYCERDLRGPEAAGLADGTGVEVYIKHRDSSTGRVSGTVHVAQHHPFDVVGWDGCLYPFALNIADFEPITGRVHQPPPVHQVFEGPNFVVCNFVPRLVDYHPQAIPVPYYHSNVDSDEVMFYVAGDYEARKGSGIGVGSVSLHPGGVVHGPQPGAIERAIGTAWFDELAVMVDTFKPLSLGEAALAVMDDSYAWTWAGGAG